MNKNNELFKQAQDHVQKAKLVSLIVQGHVVNIMTRSNRTVPHRIKSNKLLHLYHRLSNIVHARSWSRRFFSSGPLGRMN